MLPAEIPLINRFFHIVPQGLQGLKNRVFGVLAAELQKR